VCLAAPTRSSAARLLEENTEKAVSSHISQGMGGCFAANQTAAKAYYFVVFVLTVVVTWVLRDYAEAGLKHVPQIKTCFNTQASTFRFSTVIFPPLYDPSERVDALHLYLHIKKGEWSGEERCWEGVWG